MLLSSSYNEVFKLLLIFKYTLPSSYLQRKQPLDSRLWMLFAFFADRNSFDVGVDANVSIETNNQHKDLGIDEFIAFNLCRFGVRMLFCFINAHDMHHLPAIKFQII